MKHSRRQAAISKSKKGGKTARKGSVLSFKSWCLDESTKPATVIRKSEKALSDMSESERRDFCPPAKTVSSSPPADPAPASAPVSAPASNPSTPPRSVSPVQQSALERLRNQRSKAVKGAVVQGTLGSPMGDTHFGTDSRYALTRGTSRKRSRKHKRKTHRRRR